MTCSYLDHPSEEALERFLLHNSQGDELESVETHILSCEACVSRLEELEIQVAAAKLALSQYSREQKQESVPERRSLNHWFTLRTLSWAGAVAALGLVTVTPRFVSRTAPAVDVSLYANRGSGAPAVPQGRPLHLHLSAQDIANGPVRIAIVEGDGSQVWKGSATAQNDRLDVAVPKLEHPGTHFLRVYSLGKEPSPGDLLREFPFEVR